MAGFNHTYAYIGNWDFFQSRIQAGIVIPATIEDFPVVAIGDIDKPALGASGPVTAKFSEPKSTSANPNPERITSVVIPDTVTFVSGFKGLKELKTITLPKSLTAIGSEAFQSSGLTSIIIPEGVKHIYRSAFSSCADLTSVTLPESLEELFPSAFSSNKELTTVNLPSSPFLYVDTYNARSYFGARLIRPLDDRNYWYVFEKPDNSAFSNCPKLSIATRQAIQATGYTGKF